MLLIPLSERMPDIPPADDPPPNMFPIPPLDPPKLDPVPSKTDRGLVSKELPDVALDAETGVTTTCINCAKPEKNDCRTATVDDPLDKTTDKMASPIMPATSAETPFPILLSVSINHVAL
jgi:hypothetical protein